MRRLLPILLLTGISVLVGCSSKGKQEENAGRYSMKHDRYPDRPVDVSAVPDAVPRYEPKSRGGNKSPYRVLGQSYYVLDSAKGYRERGTASWYGEKFHGHLTSNGETYDMYKMSAAHKSLPLPTFARVTNLDNGRQVIVRVNDRGPFHDDRLIDLSYAAASRLEMLGKGTARVEVEAIDPSAWGSATVLASAQTGNTTTGSATAANADATGRFLQVGAYSSNGAAQRVQSELQATSDGVPVLVRAVERGGSQLYRVLIGPLQGSAEDLIARVQSAGHPAPILVDYP
ncbi:septal ring lytic transglycosylase RlpA family protein [Marinobacterium sp. D7]|uniref:septal ring lytic transglycosylase RlpA family protein n=1 Tax=Marinobacterium ramblicola TaxID=2849041 RepID=UPI001C2DB1CF|nr:septal ring lytic transglycosylase RlpA family protein [Marinobacterium ramblicola]MBV1786724.1 septal ring lytic transglycosylase RlpA family protein [Marinobacterium ramblicola]